MPIVNMKKASQASSGSGKSFSARVTTMDAELEFTNIEVSWYFGYFGVSKIPPTPKKTR